MLLGKQLNEEEAEERMKGGDSEGRFLRCLERKGPGAQVGITLVTGSGTSGRSGNGEGLESQGGGRQSPLQPLLVRTLNHDTLLMVLDRSDIF